MVNALPILTTVPADTWVEATWDEFATFADDPTLAQGRFYYDDGFMRIEMSPLGLAHGRDNSILSNVVVFYAALNRIPFQELTNTSFRKIRVRESQPDIAFYIGKNVPPLPRNNSPVNLNELPPPTLVIEVAASSLADDLDRKRTLYQKLGVQEYWVADVQAVSVSAYTLAADAVLSIQSSQVLPGLELAVVEEALRRSHTEDDGSISRWLLALFNPS